MSHTSNQNNRGTERLNSALLSIAERRITQAIEEGTLRTDSWKYKPLPLDSDSFVPDDLKMAYKILKNSGFVPPEIETRKEIQKLEGSHRPD